MSAFHPYSDSVEPIDPNWLLRQAIKNESVKGIELLSSKGVDLNQEGPNGSTPLHYAAWCGNVATVDALVRLGARVNVVNSRSASPLTIACNTGNEEIASRLLVENEIPLVEGKSEQSRAFSIGSFDFRDCMEDEKIRAFLSAKILSHALDIRGQFKIADRNIKLESSYSPLMYLPLAESLEALKSEKLFQKVSLDESQRRALQNALLLAYSTSISSDDRVKLIQNHAISFLIAGWEKHTVTLAFTGKYLAICNTGEGGIENGKKVIEVFNITPFCFNASILHEIRNRKAGSVQEAHDYLYNELPRLLSPEGSAMKDENCKLLEELAPSLQTVGNCTFATKEAALRFAWGAIQNAAPSKKRVKKWKLEGDAFRAFSSKYLWDSYSESLDSLEINAVTRRRFYAAYLRHRYRLEHQLRRACKEGKEKKVWKLLRLGADPSWKDSFGKTGLHYAAESGGDLVAQFLLKGGARHSETDNLGKTPLDLAYAKQSDKVITLLEERGAVCDKENINPNIVHSSITK